MPLYIMLANFTGRGRRMRQENPDLLSDAAANAEPPTARSCRNTRYSGATIS